MRRAWHWFKTLFMTRCRWTHRVTEVETGCGFKAYQGVTDVPAKYCWYCRRRVTHWLTGLKVQGAGRDFPR